ncbi:hypothetical protein EXIGLDRAFT_676719 [Exidia glandulosa HHB12029]|uniref:Reverse transcriptase domain-containing protein n=1 Tax=Exidia glandulosa HHB12029 TaxID=1314781 RepID=A0A165GPA8_EXIGL|nr:hypothetical protein EXIGLDRAFT_676719 [Exidia glandulosa HHB12029]
MLQRGNARPSPGPDGWEKWCVKALSDTALTRVIALHNYEVAHSRVPDAVKDTRITSLHKRGLVADLRNKRGIGISNFLHNSPAAFLNFYLAPYAARLGIIPQTQVAAQQGVQTRDLTSFLAGIQCWAFRHKTTVYALQRDQMKGFDYLAPEGFYDAIRAYGLPQAIIDLDQSAQAQNRCFIRTAYGFTDPIIVDGVTKQGASLSPTKSTFTTSLGHRYVNDLCIGRPGVLEMRTKAAEAGDLHTPEDRRALTVTMVEATDDSYIFATKLETLDFVCLTLERFQFINDSTARTELIRSIIDNFSLPAFAVRPPITVIRRAYEQQVVSKIRALLTMQPVSSTDAAALDAKVMSRVHQMMNFRYCASSSVLALPVGLHGLGWTSIARLNASLAVDGLARDLNHHIHAYREMANITLADWTCERNDCVYPFDTVGLSKPIHMNSKSSLPVAWIVAHETMRTFQPALHLRRTDMSYILRGDISATHALRVAKAVMPNIPTVSATATGVLRRRDIHWLADFGTWAMRDGRSTLWATDGSMVPATAARHEDRSVMAAVTGPASLVLKVTCRASSILHGEVMALVAASVLSHDPQHRVLSDHQNSVRLLNDPVFLAGDDQKVVYTRGHADSEEVESRFNTLADYYATSAQGPLLTIPDAPVPTFTMDEYTFHTEADGWIEGNIRSHITHFLALQAATAMGTKYRMATRLYDNQAPPEYPYTKAYRAYSAVVQLYARSGQLPTAATIVERHDADAGLSSEECRMGCGNTLENEYHIFVECSFYDDFRSAAGKALRQRLQRLTDLDNLDDVSKGRLLDTAECFFSSDIDRWPLKMSQYWYGHVPVLDELVPEQAFNSSLARRKLLYKIFTEWHYASIRLAGRIWGDFATRTARIYSNGPGQR